MAGIGVPDAKELEGRKDGENRPSFQSRDFFWDSVTLFVVGAVLALSAIDLISEYVRGSEVQCFFSAVNESFENLGEYVNEKCAGSLPPAEYLPAFIAVHAILILAPHYIWLNIFGASIDSFFHLVSGLVRTREPTTGDYPESNYVISKQLDVFSSGTYRSNWMYYLYLLKLAAQFLICFGGFLLALLSFGDFDETFPCPANEGENMRYDWPLTGENVTCVFTSLRLLHKIWLIYLALLLVAILFLTFALVWLFTDHTKELGLDKVAKFSFQTSLPFHYYVPQLTLFQKLTHLPPIVHSILSFIPFFSIGSNSSYRIHSDYDFLLVKLFRTDGGLAQVLREVHLLRKLKNLNNEELARVSIHREVEDLTNEERHEIVDEKFQEFLNADLEWHVPKRMKKHHQIEPDVALLLPPSIRGVVMGLSARCVGSKIHPHASDFPDRLLSGALCIVFDSESVGFVGALARVFRRVAVINFSQTYSDYENPARVNVKNSSKILSMTVPHDIIMTDRLVETQVDKGVDKSKRIISKRAVTKFYDDFVDEIWMPGFIYRTKKDRITLVKEEKVDESRPLSQFLTDYIVVGPISTTLQGATVNMFLREKSGSYMTKKTVMLTITPLEISGVKVDKSQFVPFRPFGFTKLEHLAKCTQAQTLPIYTWPQDITSSAPEIANLIRGINKAAANDWSIMTGDAQSKFRFSLYVRTQSSGHTATTGGQTGVQQGQTATTGGPTKQSQATGKPEGKGQSDTSLE